MAAGAGNPVLARWHERLTNWALWQAGVDSRGMGSAYDGDWGEGAPRDPPPLIGEAFDTDQLVKRLSLTHFQSVRAVYVWTGTMEERAAYIGIHPDTLTDRCTAAKFALDDMWHGRDMKSGRPNTPTHVSEKCD